MADKEAQTELKKRARRRLVGAMALATAAAIVLPMVMEQEPKPLNQDIQIRIPSQDSGTFTSRILPAKPSTPGAGESKSPSPPAAAMSPAGPGAESPAQGSSDKQAGALPKDSGQSTAAPSVGPAATNVGEKTPDKTAEKSSAKPAEKAIEKSVPKPEQKLAEKPAKGDDKSEIKTDTKGERSRAQAILDGNDQYIVQLAVLADAANATKLRERAKAEGYNSYTEALQTQEGTRTRVRVGPFPSRDSAEKAREKLKHLAPNGIVMPKS